jgi:predicted Zn-dependent peptidase
MNKIKINKPGNSTIVSVVINTGSIHENNYYKGIAHFIEHTCFKGNPTRNQKQISSAIDNVGGVLNAYTGNELTVYWAKVGNTYKDLAIEVITDLATKPLFPNQECEKEREVIIQELKMYEDDAKSHAYDLLASSLFNKGSGFHLSTIGTRESLSHINREVLAKYHKEKYNNPLLLIVGDVENKVAIETPFVNQLVPANLSNTPEDIYVERDNITQANILIGNVVEIPNLSKVEQIFCMKILDAIYGDMSGRLFDVIREQNNLVYSVRFQRDLYHNNALLWCVSMGLNKENIDKARNLAVKELSREFTVTDLETALIKAIGNEEMYLDNIVNINNEIADAFVRDIDYKQIIFNYKENLTNALRFVNSFREEINFNKNIVAGVVPKG